MCATTMSVHLQVDDARAACETVLRMSSECDVGLNMEYRAPPMEFVSLKQMVRL